MKDNFIIGALVGGVLAWIWLRRAATPQTASPYPSANGGGVVMGSGIAALPATCGDLGILPASVRY